MKLIVSLLLICLLLTSCATDKSGTMTASWYGKKFHGGLTASGEIYNMNKMTAAHKTLPLGTVLKVRNPENNKTVQVTVNNRGPYIKGRELDLSYAAASKLDLLTQGVAEVEVQKIGWDKRYATYRRGARIQ